MDLQIPKGTRDLEPEKAIVRKKIVDTLKRVFELYGFPPLETPMFERYDVLASKYAGGEEILKETFKFSDQGKRELGLRYDLTVPMCRFIAMNSSMKMPFKRYQVGEVFRDGPVATARYRQFTQCDVDVVGNKSITADAEIIALTQRAFKELGLEATVKINNRKILNDLLTCAGVEQKMHDTAILSIDKLEKFGLDSVKKELHEKGIDKKTIEKTSSLISVKGTNNEKLKSLQTELGMTEGLREMEETLSLLKDLKIDVVFDVSLARGLSYYTGIVMEVFLNDSSVKSAVCAGGRYDKIIGQFIGRGEYPAVGISFGLDRIYDAYVEKNKAGSKTVALVYIAPIGTLKESIKIAEELRNENVPVDIDLQKKGPSKNLAYANSQGIPFVVFIGEEELKSGKIKLKDMKSGTEEIMDAKDLVVFLQSSLEK